MTPRRVILAASLCAGLLLASGAHAHGQLQVEQLTESNVALPIWAIGGMYAASPTLVRRLHVLTDDPAQPVKVAVVAQRSDLLDVPEYFNRPQAYADFLRQFMRDTGTFDGMLVVVMPNGVGISPSLPNQALARLRPNRTDSWHVDPLIDTAITTVTIARQTGTRATAPEGRSVWALMAMLAGAAVLVSLPVIGFSFRRRRVAVPERPGTVG